jgi:hypothetical protein
LFNLIPGKPTLTAPSNNFWSDDNTPTFTWTFYDDDDSSQAAFQWQADDSSLFNSIDHDSGATASNEFSYTPSVSLPDGSWYWRVRTKDWDGDWSSYSDHFLINIDTKIGRPTSVKANPVSWTSENDFTVSWDNPLDVSGIQGAFYKLDAQPTSNTDGTYKLGDDITSISGITVSGDGVHPIYIWLKDNMGYVNFNFHETTNLYFDSTPPSSPTELNVTPDDWTNAKSFSIDWTDPSDLSGVQTGAYYYIGSQPPQSQNHGIWTSNKPFTVTDVPEGTSKIYVWLEDIVDNTNYLNYASASLYLDTAPPKDLSILVNDDDEYTIQVNVDLDLTASDDVSGIKDMSFSFDDTFWTDWETFGSTKSIILPSDDGEQTVYFRVNDNAGNTAKVYDKIILDRTAPHSLSISINSGASKTNSTTVVLDLSALDDTSDVYQMSFSSDGITWTNWEAYATTKSYEISSGDGEKTIYFRVNDNAGNTATAVSDSITLDTTVPEPPKTDSDKDGYTDDIDAFPNDPLEWTDSDLDGVGDNSDAFPNNKTQWKDKDGDGYGDNPNGTDPDAFPNDPYEWKDSDGDGHGDNSDHYPRDPGRWEKEDDDEPPDKTKPGKSDKDEKSSVVIYSVGIVAVIIVIILVFFFVIKPRQGSGGREDVAKEGEEVPGEEQSEKNTERK